MAQRLYTPPIFPTSTRPLFLLPSFFLLLSSFFSAPTLAQITPDGTVGTTVTGGPAFTIDGGSRPSNGPNLFHSFSQFSVPTGGSAIFNNAADVTNIISRVTGGSISNIDGLIQANGSANLFLINPAGIIFGPNARLNIGGSFIGSTAQSLKFSDGTEFSATNPSASPLLTINVPIGLQMGPNPGAILVNGVGHALAYGPGAEGTGRLLNVATNTGLQVNTGKTLALVGGNLTLNGGIVRANGGHIELGAVGSNNHPSTQVALTPTATGWGFNYSAVTTLGTIQLDQKAMAASSGTGGGSIHVEAQKLSILGRSAFVSQNTGALPGGDIRIRARESVEFIGASGSGISNTLVSDVLGTGNGGNITVTTPHFFMRQGGGNFSSRSFAVGDGGHITIEASSVELMGETSAGVISTRVGGSGKGGNITINTDRFRSQNGGGIFANVNGGSGQGGNVLINAREFIEMTRPNPLSERNSIGSSAVTGTGSAGNITLNTPRLAVLDGTIVSTSTFGFGNAGKITVNADAVEVSGFFANTTSPEPGSIRAAAIRLDPIGRQRFGLPDFPTGDAGSVTINSNTVNLRDRGQITVRNDGTNRAGNLTLNAHSVFLREGAGINASTTSGEGGNIALNLKSALLLRFGSFISATAGGSGNGGNITINAPVIVGFENSDIIANAFQGKGGNIQITTQGIFGLKFRPQRTPENDIMASSQFGLSGTVAINNVTVDPAAGLLELPGALADASRKIGSLCDSTQGSSFVYTGRGGLPENPLGRLERPILWEDVRDLSAFQNAPPVTPPSRQKFQPTMIVEANAIRRRPDGTEELVAIGAEPVPMDSAVTCAGRLWMGEVKP